MKNAKFDVLLEIVIYKIVSLITESKINLMLSYILYIVLVIYLSFFAVEILP